MTDVRVKSRDRAYNRDCNSRTIDCFRRIFVSQPNIETSVAVPLSVSPNWNECLLETMELGERGDSNGEFEIHSKKEMLPLPAAFTFVFIINYLANKRQEFRDQRFLFQWLKLRQKDKLPAFEMEFLDFLFSVMPNHIKDLLKKYEKRVKKTLKLKKNTETIKFKVLVYIGRLHNWYTLEDGNFTLSNYQFEDVFEPEKASYLLGLIQNLSTKYTTSPPDLFSSSSPTRKARKKRSKSVNEKEEKKEKAKKVKQKSMTT